MRFQTVHLQGDHQLIDNGIGDYDLICPARGNCGFVHMGQVAAVESSSCGACGVELGPIISGRPYDQMEKDLLTVR